MNLFGEEVLERINTIWRQRNDVTEERAGNNFTELEQAGGDRGGVFETLVLEYIARGLSRNVIPRRGDHRGHPTTGSTKRRLERWMTMAASGIIEH